MIWINAYHMVMVIIINSSKMAMITIVRKLTFFKRVKAGQLLSLRVWSLCSATREAAIVRGPRTAMKSGPRSPQLEKALAQKRRPNTVINKK